MNTNICTLRCRLGVKGGLSIGGAPKMHNISSISQYGHLLLGRSMCMGVAMRVWCLSSVQSLMLPTLIRIKQQVVGWASSVFVSLCVDLLCQVCL